MAKQGPAIYHTSCDSQHLSRTSRQGRVSLYPGRNSRSPLATYFIRDCSRRGILVPGTREQVSIIASLPQKGAHESSRASVMKLVIAHSRAELEGKFLSCSLYCGFYISLHFLLWWDRESETIEFQPGSFYGEQSLLVICVS